MARPLRIDYAGAWHHVMNRGAGRRTVFRDRRHRILFLELLGDLTELYRVEVHAYCLMVNHYHLLLCTPEAGLSRAMRHLDGVYTQRFNRIEKTDGPLFRGRFHSALVDADAYLLHVSRYIHVNPVDSGLVQRPELFEWSSYLAYVSDIERPWWLHTSFVLAQLGGDDPRTRYRMFVESDGDNEVNHFFRTAPPGPIIGRPEFRRQIDSGLGMPRRQREMPARRRVRAKPDLDVIVGAVAEAFGFNKMDLLNLARKGTGCGLARGAVVYLSRRIAGYELSRVSKQLGYDSYAGAASALRRLEAAIKRDAELRRNVDRARNLLNQNET